MQPAAKINVSDVIENSRIGGFQFGLFVLCGLCLIMDGFDVQAIGYVAPALRQEWHIPSALLGSVLSAALVGILFGSILFSMLADRIGRRPVLIAACLFFSAVTLATGTASSITELLALRFIAGLGLGSIMPNAIALVGEYSPARARVAVMMIVGTGFTAGAAIGGVLAFWLVPAFGWRSVFFVGGSIPLVVGVTMYFLLPESIQFLTLHGKDPHKIGHWLSRVDPRVRPEPNTRYEVRERRLAGVPLVKLFEDGLAGRTILVWVIYFMNLLNLYFLSSWLPTVVTPIVKAAGAPASYALLVGSTLQVAGVVGAFLFPAFVRRFGFVPVLAIGFVIASLNIAEIGNPAISLGMLFLVVFLAGWGVVGGQSAMNALVATLYPTDLRSTGVGSGLGVGRLGSIVGPQVAGVLIGLHWSTKELFLTAAVPALIAAVGMIAMHWVVKPQATSGAPSEVMVH